MPDGPGAAWAGCRVTLGNQREQWLIQLRPDLTAPDWFAASPAEEKFSYALTDFGDLTGVEDSIYSIYGL